MRLWLILLTLLATLGLTGCPKTKEEIESGRATELARIAADLKKAELRAETERAASENLHLTLKVLAALGALGGGLFLFFRYKAEHDRQQTLQNRDALAIKAIAEMLPRMPERERQAMLDHVLRSSAAPLILEAKK